MSREWGSDMDIQKLSKAPLIEAIFEMRWRMKGSSPDNPIVDPHYKVLVGEFYGAAKQQYPYHEQLPTADIPEPVAAYVVQHQFRTGKDRWPLIQIGPGIISLNETENYLWADFETSIINMVKMLFNTHPAPENREFTGLMLRYIDACDFDYRQSNVLEFLSSNLKINASINDELFKEAPVEKIPLGVDLKFTYPLHKPRGVIHFRCARGVKKDKPALVWETVVQSLGRDVPQNEDEIVKWADDAHALTHKWFFKMIDGKLLEDFK